MQNDLIYMLIKISETEVTGFLLSPKPDVGICREGLVHNYRTKIIIIIKKKSSSQLALENMNLTSLKSKMRQEAQITVVGNYPK